MRHLLDTNIVIAAMKGVPQVRDRLEVTRLSERVLSPVVLGELEHGVERSRYPEKNRAGLDRVALSDLGDAAARPGLSGHSCALRNRMICRSWLY